MGSRARPPLRIDSSNFFSAKFFSSTLAVTDKEFESEDYQVLSRSWSEPQIICTSGVDADEHEGLDDPSFIPSLRRTISQRAPRLEIVDAKEGRRGRFAAPVRDRRPKDS